MKRLLLVAVLAVLAASACGAGYPITCDPPRHEIVVENPYGWSRHECVMDPPPATPPPTPTPAPTPTHPTIWV